MRYFTCICLILLSLCGIPTSAMMQVSMQDKGLADTVYAAVGILYAQTESGSLEMRCTATAFEKTPTGYLFVSAAHCIGQDDEKLSAKHDASFYLTFDEAKVKRFFPIEIKGVGYQHRGDDFAFFEVATTEKWQVIALGDESSESAGSTFVNVASPLGLGKQVLYGSISNLVLERPVMQGDINWKGAIVLQMAGVNGGSSGSAIISLRQRAIIGFLVGTISNSTIVAIPVSRFKDFRSNIDNKTYKWYQLEQ